LGSRREVARCHTFDARLLPVLVLPVQATTIDDEGVMLDIVMHYTVIDDLGVGWFIGAWVEDESERQMLKMAAPNLTVVNAMDFGSSQRFRRAQSMALNTVCVLEQEELNIVVVEFSAPIGQTR
jgi:hypothetical protein